MFGTAWCPEDGRIIQPAYEEAAEMFTSKINPITPLLCHASIMAAIGTASLALVVAAPASADTNQGSSLPERSCPVKVGEKETIFYPPGTKLTTTYKDGNETRKETRECKDGQWVKATYLFGGTKIGTSGVPLTIALPPEGTSAATVAPIASYGIAS